jgi:hypothetical protein
MAAGIINIRAIQLQFFPKKLLNAVFNNKMRTIHRRPLGNNKKAEGFFAVVAMVKRFSAQEVKQYFLMIQNPCT